MDELSEKFQRGKDHSRNQKKILKILLFIEAIFDSETVPKHANVNVNVFGKVSNGP